jgi:hypothetical protein
MSPGLEALVTYQGGHPTIGEACRGWLRVDGLGVEFSPLKTTNNYFRAAHEEIKDLAGPQAGSFPDERVRSAHTRQTVVKGLGIAAKMAGSLVPMGSMLAGGAAKMAEGLTMSEAMGPPPKNRLTLVLAARGARSRASFDVIADSRAAMEEQARAFAERFAEARAGQQAPADDEPRPKKEKEAKPAKAGLKEYKALLDQGALSEEEFERLKAAHNLSARLREYKDLLDRGALSQEEFTREKGHLLAELLAPRPALVVLREYRALVEKGALREEQRERLEAALTLSALLREYKDLLDRGALTPEEFDREKEHLLAEMRARVVAAGSA